MDANATSRKFEMTDKMRYSLTLFLGMMVTIWRSVIPIHVNITPNTSIMVAILDTTVFIAVIFLNRKALKDAIFKKITFKDVQKLLIFLVIAVPLMSFGLIFLAQISWVITGFSNAPAQRVSIAFQDVFPIGILISARILAPIWEEIVFRFTARKLIPNPIVFVLLSSGMFAFIHTGNFVANENFIYFMFGLFFSISYLIVKDIRITMVLHFIQNWNLGMLLVASILGLFQ